MNQARRHKAPRGAAAPLVLAGLAAILASCLAGAYPSPPGDVARILGRALHLPVVAPADAQLASVVLDLRLWRRSRTTDASWASAGATTGKIGRAHV